MLKEHKKQLHQALVQDCRVAGKSGDFHLLLNTADEALQVLRDPLPTATVMGYKGVALLKLEKYSESLSCLEESKQLREKFDTKPSSLRALREAAVVEHSLKLCYQLVGNAPLLPSIIKYPRTTHLLDSGGTSTSMDDLVLPDIDAVLNTFCNGTDTVVIEEQVDGANLGISLCPYSNKILVQNRSHYISKGEHAQFSRIPEWVEENRQALLHILQGGKKILYGEWLTARHSIPYKKLPGNFVAFDVYDKKSETFYSRSKVHSVMIDWGIPVVPVIESRTFGSYTGERAAQQLRQELIRLLDTKSIFRNDTGTIEGIVLRVDAANDCLQEKFKVVRPDFVRGGGDGHWATRQIEKQQVDFEFAQEYLETCFPFAQD